jgi:hypothetical protein
MQPAPIPASRYPWLVAALLAGPIYGLLGQRWLSTRSLLSGLLAAAPLLLEPVTRVLHLEWGQPTGYFAELGAGVIAAGYVAVAIAKSRRLATPSA